MKVLLTGEKKKKKMADLLMIFKCHFRKLSDGLPTYMQEIYIYIQEVHICKSRYIKI